MNDFLTKIRASLSRFMEGRYGVDQLSQALAVGGLILYVVSWFFLGGLLSLVGFAAIVWSIFRTMSRNTAARSRENRRFQELFGDLKKKGNVLKRRVKEGKDYHFYTCPNPECKQVIRVPRGSGKTVEITCPRCREKFRKKI